MVNHTKMSIQYNIMFLFALKRRAAVIRHNLEVAGSFGQRMRKTAVVGRAAFKKMSPPAVADGP